MEFRPSPAWAGPGRRPPRAGVRAEILASWQRSQSLGIDRERVTLPVTQDLDPDSRLVRAAAPVLERLCARFAGTPVSVTLADAQAHILDRCGDPGVLELMDAASLVPGANVDERFMGTSSVSMVLSTREPFVVVGQEHFLHDLKALTCMAAPVRDPVGGTVQGAVNFSVPRELADPRMALTLQDATDRIAERLLEFSTARERDLMSHFLRARERGEHAELDLFSGELAGRGEAAPRLTPQERLMLLESATELLARDDETFAEVRLAGNRVAALRRKRLSHGDAEGAAVEVSFRDADGTGAAPATVIAPGGREVPLLRAPAPAGRAAPDDPAGRPPPQAPARPAGATARSAARPAVGESSGEPPSRPDAWLLLVGEPGVGRLAVEARGRLSLLNEAGVRLGTTLDMRRTAEELAEIAVPRLADVVVVDLVEGVPAGEDPPPAPLGPDVALRRVACHAHGAAAGGAATGAADDPVAYAPGTPQARCLGSGRPVADSVLTAALAGPSPGGHPVELLGEGVHAYLGAPLCASGAVLGLAGFYRRGAGPYEADDLVLAGELAARAAISVDNARRFTRERDASLTLQHSLLPRETPRVAAVDLAYRYLPADTGAGVGGDWFDVIPLSGMRVALVVGDVPGHGLQAAATMGRLRTAVRTLADLDLPPEEVPAHLDDLVGRGPDDPATGATCLYAVYDPVTRRCTAARAGHPPPAVRLPDGRIRLLDVPACPPLGLGGLQPYESATAELPEGTVLALYTDGLLKEGRAYGDVEAGTGRLLAALRGADPSPEAVCDRLTATAPSGAPRDDVALLVARLRALPDDRMASWELPADPSVVGRARALVNRQLAAWHLSELEYSTSLVVSELVTNAVRYGGAGPVGLRMLRDTALICEVSDRSNSSPRIRRAGTTEEGGRGLFLVAQYTSSWGARYMPEGKTVWAEQTPHTEPAGAPVDEDTLLARYEDLV
ncbi:SpoIIE family protein phosphatase [Streptomyces sp. NPDC018031]|uniref:SpoIIE family protein phosphatase n=1 Tax=Streptomyces sp. NPDC018031 TaxID=3365033 RepID=UPI0037A42DFC